MYTQNSSTPSKLFSRWHSPFVLKPRSINSRATLNCYGGPQHQYGRPFELWKPSKRLNHQVIFLASKCDHFICFRTVEHIIIPHHSFWPSETTLCLLRTSMASDLLFLSSLVRNYFWWCLTFCFLDFLQIGQFGRCH